MKKPARYKGGLTLTTDNSLIRMHGNMTPLSYKLTTYFLLKAAEEDRYDNIQVTSQEMQKILGVDSKKLKQYVVAEAKKIMTTLIEVKSKENPDRWEGISLIPHMIYENGVATAKINPAIEPYINFKKFAGNFTSTNYLQFIACGSSYYAMRLARVCDSWLYKGYAYYSVEEWRLLLGATNNSYKAMYSFRRLLFTAMDVVNENMDFFLTAEEIKEGRKTTHIKMIIEPKKTAKVKKEKSLAIREKKTRIPPAVKESKDIQDVMSEDVSELNDDEKNCYERMVSVYGLFPTDAYAALKKYGVVYCQRQMEIVRKADKAGNAGNKGGYLRAALEKDYAQQREILVSAKQAEIEEAEDIALWNKQAKEVSNEILNHQESSKVNEEDAHDEQLGLFTSVLSEDDSANTEYDRDHEKWRNMTHEMRKELLRMVKEGAIEFGDIKPMMDEFYQVYPEPKREDYIKKENETTSEVKNILQKIMKNQE